MSIPRMEHNIVPQMGCGPINRPIDSTIALQVVPEVEL